MLKQDLAHQTNMNAALKQKYEVYKHKLQSYSQKYVLISKGYRLTEVENENRDLRTHIQNLDDFRLRAVVRTIKRLSTQNTYRSKISAFSCWKTHVLRKIKSNPCQKIDKNTACRKLLNTLSSIYTRKMKSSIIEIFRHSLVTSSYPSISKETSMSLLEDTELKKFDEYFANVDTQSNNSFEKQQERAHKNAMKIDAANRIMYHWILYVNKVQFDKKKFAFKYWKVLHNQQKAIEIKTARSKQEHNQRSLHTKQFTFMNSEDFKQSIKEQKREEYREYRQPKKLNINYEYRKVFEFTEGDLDSSGTNQGKLVTDNYLEMTNSEIQNHSKDSQGVNKYS